YAWRAAVFDGTDWNGTWSAWQPFTVDTTAPGAATVTSSTFPAAWTTPTSGTVNVTATDNTGGSGLAGYQYKLDGAPAWTASTSAIALSNVAVGEHTLSFQALDNAGNPSATTSTLTLNAGGLASPADQARTQAQVALQATPTSPAGRPWVTYQWRTDTTTSYVPVPSADVVGGATWPEQASAGVFPAHVWNIATTAGHDGLIQVEACYGTTATDTLASLLCMAPSNVQIATTNFGEAAATSQAGPGSLALLTGDYQISATDVSVPSYNGSLTVGRSLTTLAPATSTAGAEGVFGPGWTAALPGPDAGAANLILDDHSAQGYVILTDETGAQSLYATSGASTFDGQGDAHDGSVLTKNSTTQFTLADADGTQTVWAYANSRWGVASVIEPGSSSTTTYTRDTTGRVTAILAPVPAGLTCTTPLTTAGCRTLALTYATVTTATTTVPGDYVGRLAKASFTAYNPVTSAMATVDVASYTYDSTGHLAEAWDPRVSPALKTAYTYDGAGRLATLTPPGLAAWTLNYDPTSHKLTSLTRPDPSGSTATTTIAYGVALSGNANLPDLAAAQTAGWGQHDVPTLATAVFGPDHVPAGPPAAADWAYADVSYLDVNGRQTNNASYGAGAWQIATTEYDAYGNTIRALTAGNRAEALTPTAGTDPYVASLTSSAARADLLASLTVYTADGVDETDSWGPMHPIVATDGTTIDGRAHAHTDYDQGAPTGGPFHLPTTVTDSLTPATGADTDLQVSKSGY
ncbi:MAG: sugar-binding protein, partial [Actinobacteria bacterium]|nr:sugar-binding protein [Actinomycetota bacterium]